MEMADMEAHAAPERADGQAFLNQLKATFAKMPNDIPLLLFTEKGREDVFAQANRQVIRAFRELTDKITLREYDLNHDLARKYNVSVAPTLVIAPDRYHIQWIGAPMGEEARTFLELLMLVGSGNSNASDQSLKVLERIEDPPTGQGVYQPQLPLLPPAGRQRRQSRRGASGSGVPRTRRYPVPAGHCPTIRGPQRSHGVCQ